MNDTIPEINDPLPLWSENILSYQCPHRFTDNCKFMDNRIPSHFIMLQCICALYIFNIASNTINGDEYIDNIKCNVTIRHRLTLFLSVGG
jgi:hypothetical protein